MLKTNNKIKKGKIGYRAFRVYKIVIAMLLGMIVGAFIVSENYVIPLIALLAGSGLMYFLRKRVDAVLSDERIEKIAGKASRAVYSVAVFGMALASIILMALKRKNPSYELLAYVFSYLACGMMFAYVIIFRYFYRKEV